MPEGPLRYKSAHAPVPLSELEEALLVGAGAGFSGLAFWDLPTPARYQGRSGRTFPTTRPGGHTALFFTNDQGFYVLDAGVAASKLREIETPDERGKLLETYRAQRRELRRKIADGTIRADLERKDVAKLRGQRSERGNSGSKTLTANFKPESDTTTFQALDWWRAADRAARHEFLENIT